MNIPTHKRRFQSESSISIDDMIDWSDEEEPMEEESSMPPHLLDGSLSALDSFGMEDGPQSSQSTSLMREGDDPLSRRDSVFNPSPLVLSVRKIYGEEEEGASIESAKSFGINNASLSPKHLPPPPPPPLHNSMLPPTTGMNSSITSFQAAPRRVSDASAMAIDTSEPPQTPRSARRGSHRRDSANSLPTDLQEVMMSFSVMT